MEVTGRSGGSLAFICSRTKSSVRNKISVHRLAATVLFTALGIPMLSEGQEYIRSKRGLHNTYNKGDAINQLRWDERKRPEAATALRYYRDLVALRRSRLGRSLQWAMAVPDDYVTWIEPTSAESARVRASSPVTRLPRWLQRRPR